MSRGPETRFIASVHRLLPTDLYHMKNHNTYVGGPADVWYSGKRIDIWAEYKFNRYAPAIINLMDPKKPYGLSMLQQEWLRDRYLEGRNVVVILGIGHVKDRKDGGGIVFHAREWERAWNLDDRKIESRLEIATWISETTKGSYEAPVRRGKRLERCV